jgi:hypothetical protein
MQDCITASINDAPLNPNKRVNYNFGMVLGVDDFRQEQGHFEWKHRISNLLLHGAGTVCGLQVTTQSVEDGVDVEIRISPGFAISPQGRWLWIEKPLCARLGEWLSRHRADLSPSNVAGRHTLYVKLCYAECPTEIVPIAGQPCASEEDTRAPSRIFETAHAEFSWAAPTQSTEAHFRAFGEILSRVEIVNEHLSPDGSQRLLQEVRELIRLAPTAAHASPPMPITSPPLPLNSPPEAILLDEATATDTLRKALVIWTTEVCPHFRPQDRTDDCLLLAGVHFEIDMAGLLAVASVEVDDGARPVLVPTRLIQELLDLRARALRTNTGNVRFTNLTVSGTQASLAINPQVKGEFPAISLAIESFRALGSTATVNVALTPIFERDNNRFRIIASNLSAVAIQTLSIRWRAIGN